MAKGQIKQKLTPDTIRKLEEAFAIDASVEEACYYADISRETYYRWIKENPKLYDKFERLRNRPVLLARQTVVKSLTEAHGAQWYLERKRKKEFAQRTEITGEDGEAIKLETKLINDIDKIYGPNTKTDNAAGGKGGGQS